MVNHSEGEYVNRKGSYINGLEEFWGYLKRQLSSRGGIKKEKRALYLSPIFGDIIKKLSTEEKIWHF